AAGRMARSCGTSIASRHPQLRWHRNSRFGFPNGDGGTESDARRSAIALDFDRSESLEGHERAERLNSFGWTFVLVGQPFDSVAEPFQRFSHALPKIGKLFRAKQQ